jgi:branched-chain amino acid transport system ATP-binding protein
MEEKGDLMFSIQDIRDDLGITVLLVEHDMNLIMDISDRILALNYGEKIAEGLPEEIQKDPEVLKAYLGEEERVAQS